MPSRRSGSTGTAGTPGPSVRVTTSNGITQVISSPHPIHYAEISRSRALGRWLVVVRTATVQVRDFRDLMKAVQHAGWIVGTLYRVDMRDRFTGPQRLAMGRAQCPAHVPCADPTVCVIQRPDHKHLCKVRADFLSVWCIHHTRVGGGGL